MGGLIMQWIKSLVPEARPEPLCRAGVFRNSDYVRRRGMALTAQRPRRRFAVRATLAVVALTLVSTGLVAPASSQGPIVEEKEHTLAAGRVGGGWSKATDTDISTQLVGVSWSGRQEGGIEVRARQDSGGWGEWIPLHGDPAEGPDAGSPRGPGPDDRRGRSGWAPAPSKVEVRVTEGEVGGVKLHAIRSEDTPRRRRACQPRAGAAMAKPASSAGRPGVRTSRGA